MRKTESSEPGEGSVETWILENLQRLCENLSKPYIADKMQEIAYGSLIAIENCMTDVRIISHHDEIIAAFKKAVNLLREGEGKTFLKTGSGLIAVKKLEAEKNGDKVDWESYGIKLAHCSGPRFLKKEMKRVWG